MMSSHLRKLVLTSHLAVSLGWLGAAAAYLALAVAGIWSPDQGLATAAYRGMEVIGWAVIVPASLAALFTGVIQSLGTEWGLFRHYWIVAKLGLTTVATAVLLVHIPNVSRMARIQVMTTLTGGNYAGLRMQLLVHALGGLSVLLMITAISVYKPWGRIGSVRPGMPRGVSTP